PDGIDDPALADQVAVADLSLVRQSFEIVPAAAEQSVAGRHRGQEVDGALAQRIAALEQPQKRAGGIGLPEEYRTYELVIADDHFLIDAARRIEMTDDFAFRRRRVHIAHRHQIDAHDLELRGQPGTFVNRVRLGAGKYIGQHPRLLVNRIDQAIK